jgi:hypothetical protein
MKAETLRRFKAHKYRRSDLGGRLATRCMVPGDHALSEGLEIVKMPV